MILWFSSRQHLRDHRQYRRNTSSIFVNERLRGYGRFYSVNRQVGELDGVKVRLGSVVGKLVTCTEYSAPTGAHLEFTLEGFWTIWHHICIIWFKVLHIYCLRLCVALLLRPTGAGYVTYDAGVFASIDLRHIWRGRASLKTSPSAPHAQYVKYLKLILRIGGRCWQNVWIPNLWSVVVYLYSGSNRVIILNYCGFALRYVMTKPRCML